MNQQCKVCGEPAAGFHFGAFTCEGCKSFFGRTYNNLGSISECKNGGVCVINKKNRTACKACRLRKCLMVGMSKSGSRYGRRSNWFKIHCLLQEQSNGGSQGVGGGGGGGGPFAGGFLPGFLPPSQSHAHHAVPNAYASKEAKERGAPASPSQEDLALQSHLLHVAIMKQERERGNKSPHPDDVALQNQLRLLAWQKERERASQHQQHHHQQQNHHHHQHQHQQHQHQQPPGTPPRDSSPPFGFKHRASPIFPINFAQEKMTLASSPPRVFRPFLPTYKRTADTPSDSGASSSVEPGEHDESGSNSALSYFKASAASPTLSEREFPRKINATVTLTTTTTGYHPHRSLVYPPPGLVTPAASQHSPRGGDLLLVSPSPGGLAIEQDEPIDLSVRTSRSSPRPGGIYRNEDSDSPLNDEDDDDDDDDDDEDDEDDDDDRSSRAKHRETTAKSKPLDLTLGLKRPAELFLTL